MCPVFTALSLGSPFYLSVRVVLNYALVFDVLVCEVCLVFVVLVCEVPLYFSSICFMVSVGVLVSFVHVCSMKTLVD